MTENSAAWSLPRVYRHTLPMAVFPPACMGGFMHHHLGATLLGQGKIAPADFPDGPLAGGAWLVHVGAEPSAPGLAARLHVVATPDPHTSQAQGRHALPQALVRDRLGELHASLSIRGVQAIAGAGHGPRLGATETGTDRDDERECGTRQQVHALAAYHRSCLWLAPAQDAC